jgi:ETFB lysine methyltransferase
MDDVALAALEADLRQRYRVTETEVKVGAVETLQILHPASADELISEAEFGEDERLPYWADLWPSAVVLARFLRGLQGNGRTLLELGCGSGLVASAAARAGFEVTATDYYEDSPRFAQVNAWRATQRVITAAHADWTTWPTELRNFDLVVGSDLLYERRYAPLVAKVLASALGPHGEAWIADPGRVGAGSFPDWCVSHALGCETMAKVPIEAGAHIHNITLYRITR